MRRKVLTVFILALGFMCYMSAARAAIQITFWHSMSGSLGDTLETVVKNFNASQKDIVVTSQYQGSYDDSINKMKSAMISRKGPDVVQIYDIGTRFMIDSSFTVPVQNFLDSDKSFNASQLEPNLLAYYTVNNKLNSMPFNSSTPILYYNKTAFRAAGLDPNKPPKNFNELEAMAKKLTKKDASGKTVQYGYSMAIYGWFFEQFLIKQEKNFADNGNGRKSPATMVDFDKNGAGIKVFAEWKKLVDSGVAANFGRKTPDTQSAFAAGNIAMFIDSTAILKALLASVGGKYEVGTAFLPSINPTDKGGVSIGGASLWIIDNKDSVRQKAAWEFIKFMVSAKQQSFWNANTGYFPVTKAAYQLDETKGFLKANPQFQTAIDQLHASSPSSRGALLGIFPEARSTIELNIEEMISGKKSPADAISASAKVINLAMKKYNDSIR